MAPLTVVYDACVLYPAPLRDLLMRLAITGMFRARWTYMIHDEWMRSVLAARPDLTAAQLARTRSLMDAHVPDCLVTGFEHLIQRVHLPDPDDRHVVAAALASGADLIVTFNLADFPATALAPLGIRPQHPDEFVADLVDADSRRVCRAAALQRRSLRQPPKSVEEYLDTLLRQGLPLTVGRLQSMKHTI